MTDAIQQFVDKLVMERGIDNLDEEVLTQLKSDLRNRVEDRINATLLENMPPEKLEEFEKLLSSETSAEPIQKFCQDNIPNLDQVLAQAFLDFRRVYLNL